MPNARRFLWGGVLAAGMLAAAAFALWPMFAGRAATTSPAPAGGTGAPATTAAPGRSVRQIMQDVRETRDDLNQVITSPRVIFDESRRRRAATPATKVLKRMTGYLRELAGTGDPRGIELAAQLRPHFVMLLALFGDADAERELNRLATDGKGRETLPAQLELLTLGWIRAGGDAKAQADLAARAETLARENPAEEAVTDKLIELSEIGPASGATVDRLQTAAAGMKTHTAEAFREQLEGRRKLRALQDQPLAIAGPLNGGGTFSTAGWKGKVILVDFWATWCGPCRAALPDVKKAYADYHDKGLEIVGVSCDNSAEDLAAFLKANPDMPWPQLFDAKNPGWNAIATGYGVTAIPTMFLIDRDGIVRSVDAGDSLRTLIPQFLSRK